MVAGLVAAGWIGVREWAGRSALGARSTADLPDTRFALMAAFLIWVPAQIALGVWFQSSAVAPATRLIAVSLVHVALALALLKIALRGARPLVGAGTATGAGLLGGLAVYGVVALVSIGLVEAYAAAGAEVPQQDVVGMFRAASPAARVVMMGTTVLLAPFAEEVFYRGILLPALARAMPLRSALVAQALVFGFVHFWAVPAAWPLSIAIAVVGWGAGWLYVRTGSLGAAIVLHATFNGIQVALLLATL